MSKKDIKRINRIWRGFFFVLAAVIAVCAWIWNPGHLFTAGLILAFGINSEIISKDAADIC